ncbi:hypothetical protein SISSUDRAFT_1065706 [Sistotremastrum suecicum HHB10207 ss-3]|uniref:Uncharacterized protein n=1 Tax=Sistotremastrum suecicum HHB10207 ss-3 TaxID=1314776 RepID=A0A165Z5B0_9AGAM|nr:hypothetical protein SISSUDRAFT_1065706 [Sistotremastrum suecicum HHB10207 ss-3]
MAYAAEITGSDNSEDNPIREDPHEQADEIGLKFDKLDGLDLLAPQIGSVDDMSFQQLQSLRHALTQSTARAMASLNRYINSRTPVGKLPDELLSKILILYAHSDVDHPLAAGTWIMFPGRGLLEVSARWRNVALNTRQLWTHLILNWSTEYLRYSLKNSLQCNLHIRFDTQRHSCAGVKERFTSVIANSCRIQSLNIVFDSLSLPFIRALCETHTPAPNITFRYLWSGRTPREHQRDVFLSFRFPNLRHVSLDGVRIQQNDRSFFSHVVSLEVKGGSWAPREILEVLRETLQLERLVLVSFHSTGYDESTSPDSNSIIPLPHLKRLEIISPSLGNLFPILKLVETPILHTRILELSEGHADLIGASQALILPYVDGYDTLYVDGNLLNASTVFTSTRGKRHEVRFCGRRLSDQPFNRLLHELKRYHGSRMTSLHLRSPTFPPTAQIVSILGSWNKLSFLKLGSTGPQTSKVFEALESADTILCPNLRTLDLADEDYWIFVDPQRVAQLLERRRAKSAPIHALRVGAEIDTADVDGLVERIETVQLPLSSHMTDRIIAPGSLSDF